MDRETLLTEIARGNLIALVPSTPAPTTADPPASSKRWYTMQEVADQLGFGLCKVKDLVIRREIRSVKVGRYRRILPEWVDEYIERCIDEVA